MALVKCPECGTQISDKASNCQKCGCPIEKNGMPIKTACLILIAIVLVMSAFIYSVSGKKSKQDASAKQTQVINPAITERKPEIKTVTASAAISEKGNVTSEDSYRAEHIESIKRGKKLVKKYLDANQATLFCYGDLTNDPRLSFVFHKETTWKKITQVDKESICIYIKSLIPEAKSNPEKYIYKIPKGAPVYPMAVKNIRNMCLDCWDVSHNYGAFVIGDEAWARIEYKDEKSKSFSEFSNRKYSNVSQNKGDTRDNTKMSREEVFDHRMKQLIKKINTTDYYNSSIESISIGGDNILINVNDIWIHSVPKEREELIKNIFSFWTHTGKLSGIEENPSDYTIKIMCSNKKVASWDGLRGFVDLLSK
ncbi:MAG: zinc ribbon domain-containing protein [Desulfovibrio sp.]|jgi:Na+-transporting methylmalonyl-CoA/oxaloacetate decarboxylase gamma subunit|nr:zinc ribbon domain-containing protein [Desulfovibrio sp.]